MKSLVLATFMAVMASLATGCIISSGDDGVDPGDDGPGDVEYNLNVDWAIGNVGSSAGVNCPVGADAILHAQPVDDDNNNVGAELTVTFPCEQFQGTALLPADVYAVWLEITDYAETPSWEEGMADQDRNDIEDLLTADNSHTFAFWDNGGYFAVEWTLPAGETCASAGADGAFFTPTLSGTTFIGDPDVFNCEAGFGITAEYIEGQYVVAGQLVTGPNDEALGPADSQNLTMISPNVTVMAPRPFDMELD
jgi:hypothetical protein